MAILLLAASAASRAQVVPAAIVPASTGEWSGLPVSGALHYDVRYSQTAQFGGSQDGQQMSYISGDASYANTGKRLPFSMQYGAGYGLVWAGPPSAGNVFQHLTLSQVESVGQRRCKLFFSDPNHRLFGSSRNRGADRRAGHANPAGPDDPDGEYPLDRQLYDARVRT